MKVLCVTFEAPSRMYGGGLGIIQSLESLSANAEIDYVGPFYQKEEFEKIRVRNYYFLEEEHSFAKKVLNLLRGVPVRFYNAWKRNIAQINFDEYDIVFVDFSYNDFVLKQAKKYGKKTLVRVHNIERDMVSNTIRTWVMNKYWIRSLINGWIIRYREKRALRMADGIIYLTREDMKRGGTLYGEDLNKKSAIIPVCLDKPGTGETESVQKNHVLATGSLYYGPNAIGIKWFIKNVWRSIQREELLPDTKLFVAGRQPDSEMITLCEETANCVLIDSPERIEPYFESAILYVAPIFSGAGMKVKVAEALSYGLPVIGTHHALIGYEDAVGYIWEADDPNTFKNLVIATLKACDKDMRSNCIAMHDTNYSMNRSRKSFGEIIERLHEGRILNDGE